MTLADTIREISRKHLEAGGLIMGQNLDAIQNVCNTVPMETKHPGIVVMPTTETAGAGIAVGAALSGIRVIHVIRFQSFLWLQASPIVNYAAKAKEIWGYKCPLWIRAIAFDDYGSGPVHTNCFHSPFMHVPGITVVAPTTPGEYQDVWKAFIEHSGPFLVSEHRSCYGNAEDVSSLGPGRDITIVLISASRLHIRKVKQLLWDEDQINADIIGICWLKPFKALQIVGESVANTGRGLVVDSTYAPCSAAEHIAYTLMLETGCPVKALGMEDRSSGIAPGLENTTPSSERIAQAAKEMLR